MVPVQALAVRVLLAHRLSGDSAEAAKAEWYEVVEGDHALWRGVSEPYKHTIRAFLVYFHTQILRHSTERFNFRNGSVGAAPGLPLWAHYSLQRQQRLARSPIGQSDHLPRPHKAGVCGVQAMWLGDVCASSQKR